MQNANLHNLPEVCSFFLGSLYSTGRLYVGSAELCHEVLCVAFRDVIRTQLRNLGLRSVPCFNMASSLVRGRRSQGSRGWLHSGKNVRPASFLVLEEDVNQRTGW